MRDRRHRLEHLVAVAALSFGCQRAAPLPSPATDNAAARRHEDENEAARAASRATKTDALKPRSAQASFQAPDHWSTHTRDPSTVRGRAWPEPSTLVLAATVTSLDGDEADEGDVLLDRRRDGDELAGSWGETSVEGSFVAGSTRLALRDVGTQQTIFEGTLEGGVLRGILGGEGRLREVQSKGGQTVLGHRFRVDVGHRGGRVVVEVVDGEIKEAGFFEGKGKARTKQTIDTWFADDRLHWRSTDRRSEGQVEATANGFVVRDATSHGPIVPFEPQPAGWPLPFLERAPLLLTEETFRLGRPDTSCDIFLGLPRVEGMHDAMKIQAELRRLVIESAAPIGGADDPPATLGSYACDPPDLASVKIQSGSVFAWGLAGSYVGLRVEGYARFGEAGGTMVSSRCLLLDAAAGTLNADVLSSLLDDARPALAAYVDRALKRRQRSAKLDLDEFYTQSDVDDLPDGVTACVLPKALRLLIPLGSITKNQGGAAPLFVDIPSSVLARVLPSEHAVRRAFR